MDTIPADVAALLRVRDGIYADALVMAAVGRLDLITVMAEEPGTIHDLCRHNSIAYRSADVLCTLLRSMELLEPGETLKPTGLAMSCLVRGSPYDLRSHLAAGVTRPLCLAAAEMLRTGRPQQEAGVWTDLDASASDNGGVPVELFAPSLAQRLEDIPIASVLDLGDGGHGHALAAGRDDLLVTKGYDVFDPLPDGHDLHLLVEVLQRRPAAEVRAILTRCFDALWPGGRIVDHDVHLNADKSGPLSAAEHSALLLSTTEGQVWSVTEMSRFLTDAGFVDVEERPTAADRTAIIGRKPAA